MQSIMMNVLWTRDINFHASIKGTIKKIKVQSLTWTRKTLSEANRLMEVATLIVSRPDATTNKGPSLGIPKTK